MRALLLLSIASMTSLVSAGILRSDASSTTLGYYTADACTIKCRENCTCGDGWEGHDAESTGGTGGGGHHPECQAGANCNNIHQCGGSETFHPELKGDSTLREEYIERLHAVQEAAARGSVSAAVELLSAYPEHTECNEARKSIQLAGCSKDVLSGNIPLSEAQLVAISEVE